MPLALPRPAPLFVATSKALCTTLFIAAGLSSVQAQTTDSSGSCPLVAETRADGLAFPWGLAFLNDSTALVSERLGGMQVVDLASGSLTEVANVPDVVDRRQGGLLDVVIAPDFASTGTLFFSFSEPRGSGATGTSIGRAKLSGWEGEQPSLSDVDVIFQQSGADGSGVHFGSRIVILPDETLAFTIGDRGTPERAQDGQDHAGSVLRIHQDGSVPEDNPFTGPNATQPEIWSLGHRNPQGAALDPATGQLWTVEHGARGGDEVNQPQAGRNYGWPTISYGVNYSGSTIGIGTQADGLEQPVYYWDPSIAPSGMAILGGSDLFPGWQGDMLVGALRAQTLVRLDRSNGAIIGEERLFEGTLGRIRDVRQGPDGAIWLLTDASDGALVRVTPQNDAC